MVVRKNEEFETTYFYTVFFYDCYINVWCVYNMIVARVTKLFTGSIHRINSVSTSTLIGFAIINHSFLEIKTSCKERFRHRIRSFR